MLSSDGISNEQFGSLNPYAEPPWYNAINSPYYKASHRHLREFIRAYVDEYIIPNCEEWENQGFIPKEVFSPSKDLADDERLMNDMQKWGLSLLEYSPLLSNTCQTLSFLQESLLKVFYFRKRERLTA